MVGRASETIGVDREVGTAGDVWFGPSGPNRWLMLGYLIGGAGMLTYIGVLMLQSTRAIWIGALLLLIVLAANLAVVTLWTIALFRPIRIAGNVLRVPRLVSTQEIPLSDIAGVGLLFKKESVGTRRSSGWYPYVWRGDGSAIRLGTTEFVPRQWIRPGDPDAVPRKMVMKGNIDELRSTDPQLLAESPVGRLAAGIHEQVAHVQGPVGLLLTRHLQKVGRPPPNSAGRLTAYWSPDGEVGKLGAGYHVLS